MGLSDFFSWKNGCFLYILFLMIPEKREHCVVCGSPLLYRTAAEEARCTSCGKVWQAHIACPNGHILCDACHGKEARKVIEAMVTAELAQDPIEIAERMMAHPALPMLSCDHAFIAAGALLAALRHSPYGSRMERDVQEVFDRIEQQARGGYCALTGVCGIVPAVGAVFSVFLTARCGADREQRIVMEVATRTMRAITNLTGPSCCKAYVRSAIAVAADHFAETLGIVLPVRPAVPVCEHAERHPHGCREERCPYYRKPSKDIFAEAKWAPGIACTT
jgi:hypothetical protein